MATQRIESGQIALRGPGGGVPMQQIGVQQTDMTVASGAAAKGASTLAQLIDRMSGTAFEMAGQQVQQRALVDVANTPLTPEQLEAARNGDMSSLNLGGTINLYDAAVRKARSFELAGRFDTEAKAEVVKVLADVETGTMTTEQAATKLNTLTSGFGRSLAQVDGDAAIKFTASMGVYANTVMAEAYKLERKREADKKQLLLDASFNDDMRLLEPTVARGFYVDANGQERPIDEVVGVYRKNLSDRAFAAGGLKTATDYLAKFDKAVAEAKVNAASRLVTGDDFAADPVAGLNRIRSGDLGRMSVIYQQMPQDDRAKVEANFITAINHRESLKKAQQEQAKTDALRAAVPLLTEAYALPDTSPRRKALNAQITQIANENPTAIPLGTLRELLKPDPDAGGNPLVEFNVLSGIHNGTITDPAQIGKFIGSGLSARQAVTLTGKLMAENRRDQTELDRGISKLAGIPVIPGQVVVIDPKGQEFKRRQQLTVEATQIQSEAQAKGEILSPRQVLEQLETRLEKRRNSESAKQATAALDRIKADPKNSWISGEVTLGNIETLRRKAGADRARLNTINQIERYLRQQEGDN